MFVDPVPLKQQVVKSISIYNIKPVVAHTSYRVKFDVAKSK